MTRYNEPCTLDQSTLQRERITLTDADLRQNYMYYTLTMDIDKREHVLREMGAYDSFNGTYPDGFLKRYLELDPDYLDTLDPDYFARLRGEK